MQNQASSVDEHDQGSGELSQVPSEKKKRRGGGNSIRNFVHWNQEEQRTAFFA